jgi:hypothetical protein
LETEWKKSLQSFLLENLWKPTRLQSQTVQKDCKLFHLQTKQSKKTGNFFTYKPNNQKRLGTFSLMNKTMENYWKQWKTPWKKITNLGNCGQIVLMGILATFVARHSSESCNGGQL